MKRLELSPEAEADLLDIGTYIAADDPGRAHSFIDDLEARCAALLDFPDTGRPRPELGENLRSKPHGRYVIFYTPGIKTVRVERILHGARDVRTEFGKGEDRSKA